MAYNFQIRSNKIKLLTECENVTENILLLSYTFIFREKFYFILFDLKIIGHGNTDNILESLCILIFCILVTIERLSKC
jgi:hypothetical protein